RLRATKRHPYLFKHTKAIRRLGPASMSSDESCAEGTPHRAYIVLKKSWRATAVTLWLRDIDRVHPSPRLTFSGRIEPGKWPHECRDSNRKLTSQPIRHLPKNFYDAEFINVLSVLDCKRLNVDETIHDLS
ncbi:hypothetical protein K439DRAFT_1313922, partial [Ramaria rubella]